MQNAKPALVLVYVMTLCACSGGSSGPAPVGVSPTASPTSGAPTQTPSATPTSTATATPTAKPTTVPTPSPSPTLAANTLLPPPAALVIAPGLYADIIESTVAAPPKNGSTSEGNGASTGITNPRELAALPNGDLIVGTMSSSVYIIPNAENAGAADLPALFATMPDVKAQGVAYSSVASAIFVATTNGVYEIPYHTGDRSASSIVRIAKVRTGSVSSLAPPGDSDVHTTTSVTASKTGIFIGVGSSCNACAETDPTRAVVLAANFDGSNLRTVATRIRNPVALAVDPVTQDVWVGGAGQDCLPQGFALCSSMDDAYASDPHPYEYVDNLTLAAANTKNVRANEADYAWPVCEENHRPYSSFALTPSTTATPMPADYCTTGSTYQAEPLVEFPAYSTHIGMAVYAPTQSGTYALPAPYDDALIVSNHGSWHETSHGIPVQTPSVSYVPLSGRLPATTVDFSRPGTQYQSILFNYQADDGARVGQPSGIAVGQQGSIFIADDYAGVIYRVRPGQDPNHFDARARNESPKYRLRH